MQPIQKKWEKKRDLVIAKLKGRNGHWARMLFAQTDARTYPDSVDRFLVDDAHVTPF